MCVIDIYATESVIMILELETNSPISESLLDKIFVYACEYLDMPEDAYVILSFDDLGEVSGYCDEEDIEERAVRIEINKRLSYKDIAVTVFHEMVHCRQILSGDLVQGYNSKWKGVEYNGDYYELPWEVEAYKLEEEMVRGFFDG